MRVLFRLSMPLLLPFLLAGAHRPATTVPATCANAPARLAYTLQVDPHSATLLVRGRLDGSFCGPVRFRHPTRLGPYALRLLTEVTFRDARGPRKAAPDGPGSWVLTDIHGPLFFSYRVRTDPKAHDLPDGNVWRSVMPYVDAARLYLTRYAFMLPDNVTIYPSIRLTWYVPEGWTLVTPWQNGTTTVDVPGLYALLKNYYAAFRGGDVRRHHLGTTDVTLAWTGPGTISEATEQAMLRVVRTLLDLEPGGFGPHLTFLLHDTAREGHLTGGTAGISSIQLQFPHDVPLERIWPYAGGVVLRTMAHEMIHTWTYAREQSVAPSASLPAAWDDSVCWLREGVTEYLAHQALLDAGLLDTDALALELEHTARRARQHDRSGSLTLADACTRYYEDTDAFYYTYYEGMVFAFRLDAELRRFSEGRKSLRGFMQAFIPPRRGETKDLEDFLTAWRAYAPPEVADVASLLTRPGGTDPHPYLTRPARSLAHAGR